jgi:cellulose synthase/poly-beta-1,6-N-acetylglucosamine synthase-like glycosyltransferase
VDDFPAQAAARGRSWPQGGAFVGQSTGARREPARSAARVGGAFAPEIAFLVGQGLEPGALLQAAAAAERDGLSAEQALLGEGLLGEEAYYRALANRLRLPFYRGEIPVAQSVEADPAIVCGVAPLAPNRAGLRVIAAPRAAAIRYLLGKAEAGALPSGLAIASPHMLSDRVRAEAGARIAEAAAGALEQRDPALCARSGLCGGQCIALGVFALIAAAAAAVAPETLTLILSAVLWSIFTAAIVLRNLAVAAAGAASRSAPLADAELPIYTIIAPLRGEERIVAELVRGLEALDYPRGKLDIKLVVERDDAATQTALEALDLPARYEIVIAPPGLPATKPRALNVALPAARGALVVVFDAEDAPDPDQLRLAAARFAGDPDVDCLQAALTIDNAGDSWISAMFAIEYATLFDLIDPGLAALDLPIPLGGTSNHFRVEALRRVGGWDAWNVTEDADLGMRLAFAGARVGALASSTTEEAPADFAGWFRQRVRWQKGWMQTLIVHSRRPLRFARALGLLRAFAALALIGGSTLGGLFGPQLFLAAVWRAVSGQLATATAWQIMGDVAIYLLAFSGLMTMAVPGLTSMRRRRIAARARILATLPLYYALICVATWAALFDLAIRPFHWAKTEHGLSRARRRPPAAWSIGQGAKRGRPISI